MEKFIRKKHPQNFLKIISYLTPEYFFTVHFFISSSVTLIKLLVHNGVKLLVRQHLTLNVDSVIVISAPHRKFIPYDFF